MNSDRLNELSKDISSPVPFWFLNGHVDEWHIVREFQMMAEKGIGDVIVHPRYGLQVEYLSDGWFEIFGWCVREAKKHGMHVWIYDELNWPSGTAGMSVMQMNEDYQSKFLAVESKPLSEIDLGSFEPGAYVVAANVEGDYVTKTRLIEDVETLRGLTGNWRIFNCRLRRDQYYIDTLSLDAVNAFKHVTYDAYYDRFKSEFGNTIRAVFTDEPSIYWVSVGYDDCNLPYTDDYFSTFRARFGYDAAPMIPYLFYPGREGTAFRADYWDHAGHLFNERYHGNLGRWCRQHGVIYTGHNNHEEPLRYQIRYQGDMFGTMRTMDIPGVDHLGKQTLGNSWISILGHKICASAAHISGKARCMSESFGVMEWDTTYTNLKRVTDWQYAQGINLLIPHAIYHTISGMTKRECPPSFFYQSPHWDDFGYFVDYVKRLEEMLCGGRHLCKVAILYPNSGLWASYQSDRKTPEFEYTDNFLNSLCLELVKNQIDFDLLDFKALKDAALDGRTLKLADEDYEVLIVPVSPYLRPEEVARLNEIVRAGVQATFFYRSMEPIPHNLPEGLQGASFVRTEELEAFVDILKRGLDCDIQIVGGGADDIMAYRREKDGRKITFLLNRSEKHRKVTAMIKDYPDAAVFDSETGEYAKLEGRQAGRKLQAQLRFQPNQSYFIVSGMPDAPAAEELKGEPAPIEIENVTVETPYNLASLYHFRYKPRVESGERRARDSAEQSIGGANKGIGRGEVGVTDVDVRTNPRFIPANWSPNVPDWTQFAGVYEADVEINLPPEGIRLVMDKDYAECEVYVNGTLVELEPCCGDVESGERRTKSNGHLRPYVTDLQDMQAQVCHLLREGTNTFTVVSPTKLSEPLRLVGDFTVELKGKQVCLNPSGGEDPFRLEMGHPFYSGTVTYRAEFDLDADFSALILNLHDVRDSAAVYVNGKLAGKRLWAPYTLDIARFAHRGRNEVTIEVRNNMTNLIYGNPRALGLQNVPSLAGFGD